jgi:Ca2+-binding RTX toxin-like protein
MIRTRRADDGDADRRAMRRSRAAPYGRRTVLTLRIALLTALALLVPPVAHAATISYSDGVVYASDPGETLDAYVGYEPGCVDSGGTTYDCVTFSGDAITAAPAQCAALSGRESCVLDPNHRAVRISGGDGADSVHVYDAGIGGFPARTPYAISIAGGAGDDTLVGGDAGEHLDGGAGNDRIAGLGGDDTIDGGDGADRLSGDSDDQNTTPDGGDDVVRGGPGDDRLTGDGHDSTAVIGHDVLDGGPGSDTVYDDWYRFDGSAGDEDPPPAVSLDGQADDGRPGERDDVVAIERIDTGYQPAQAAPGVYTGGDGPDTFDLIFADGHVSAGAGDDVVTGADGADAIDGGPGADRLSGGFGPDVIVGGPGADDIGGDRTAACEYGPVFGVCTIGSGADTIDARDGERDTIDCGPGADTVYADAIDVTAGCETVLVAGGPAPTPVPAPTPPPTAPAAVARLSLGHPRLAVVARSRAFTVTCHMVRAGRCSVRAAISARAARKLHLKPRRKARTFTLGSGHRRFAKAGSGRVRVKLSRKVARALRHAHSLRVTFTLTATGSHAVATTRTVRH